MRIAAVLLTMTLFFGIACPGFAKDATVPDGDYQGEAVKGFEKILDLWRDGRYQELYDRTYGKGGDSKERFSEKLAAAPHRPACCWEKMQDVKATAEKENHVTLRARIGIEGGAGVEPVTRSFRLVREEGVWKASRADIISLSGASKKKKRFVKRSLNS